jgi:hypothetical protein
METMPSHRKINLGFTHQEFEPGVHICQIISNDEEREDALLQYVLSGLQTEERIACFSEKVEEKAISQFLELYGINYAKLKEEGAISLAKPEEIYFEHDRFDPERMLTLLTYFHDESKKLNYSAARVIGEMTPKVQDVEGGSRLLEYESKVSMLLKTHPITAVCQYDARAFDGGMIMDILKVHPFMIVRGSVVHNPFYVHPEDYLSKTA